MRINEKLSKDLEQKVDSLNKQKEEKQKIDTQLSEIKSANKILNDRISQWEQEKQQYEEKKKQLSDQLRERQEYLDKLEADKKLLSKKKKAWYQCG